MGMVWCAQEKTEDARGRQLIIRRAETWWGAGFKKPVGIGLV